MATSKRAGLIAKIQRVLKKHYTPALPPADRPLLEQLLYAVCLENAPYEKADEVFAKLQHLYFDWNEVRVTTVTELADVAAPLPDAKSAAANVKRILQSVFESIYDFDIEIFKKQNIGTAAKDIAAYEGVTPFAAAYVTQHGLGGHSIPLDKGTLDVLVVLGLITPEEAHKHVVPGLERAIPKAKGPEFASLLHQFGADFIASPFSTRVKAIVLEIAPDAKDRLPKRSAKKKAAKPDGQAHQAQAAAQPPGESAPQRVPQRKPATQKATAKAKSPTKKLTKRKPR